MSHIKIKDYKIVEDMPVTNIEHTGPAAYILYSTSCPLYYIGSTINLKGRLATHCSYIKTNGQSNEKLAELFSKSPEGVLVRYYKCIDREHAYTKEQEYLNICFGDEDCCNKAKTALPNLDNFDRNSPEFRKKLSDRMKGNKLCLGRSLSDVVKAKMSASIAAAYAANPRSQETVAKWRESVKDYIPTEETKAKWRAASDRRRGIKRDPEIGKKISIARMGIEFSDEHKEKLSKAKYFPVTVYGVTYSNRREAMRLLNLSKGQLCNLLGETKKQTRPVAINGMIYDTVNDAARDLGLSKGQLTRRLLDSKYPDIVYLN
jgi:predicted GIY-YIG superfamily endonuclease